MAYEEPRATWDKRFKARHYSYRDSAVLTTQVYTSLQTLMLAAQQSPLVYYVFGANARIISRYNWPQQGDYPSLPGPPLLNCYAREVLLLCDEDAWVRIVSVNPVYVRLLVQGYTAAQIMALGVSPVIFETEMPLLSGDYKRYYPSMGYALVFRADTVSGTLYVEAEGNMEGNE